MATEAKFDELDREAAALSHSDPVYEGVNSIIAHAADNAEDGEATAMASVSDLLAYTADAAVVAWFTSRGVSF